MSESNWYDNVDPGDLANSTNTSTAVQLPFFAPVLWWKNGEAQAKKNAKGTNGAQWCGGWGMSAEHMEQASAEYARIPEGFALYSMANSEGGDYDAYLGRAIGLAPIATRKKWAERSMLNILAYAATYDAPAKMYIPWGMVVVSAKGYAAMAIEDALRTFSAKTAGTRRTVNNLPASAFYAMIGTFAPEPQIVMRGKQGKQSPTTPAQVVLPKDEITQEQLGHWFVGKDVLSIMVEAREEARTWVEDWKNARTDQAVDEEQEPQTTAQPPRRNAPLETSELPF